MKQHHVAFTIGVIVLAIASFVDNPEFKGWWIIGGMMFLALSFVLYMTRR